MTSRYYTMTDSTGASGFLPTVVFDGSSGVFTSLHRTTKLSSLGITGFYEADFADSVTTIDYRAFSEDTMVVVVTINRVTTIGEEAFRHCSALRSITLDCAVDANGKYLLTSIASSAFQSCISLRNLYIPDTIKNIPMYLCFNCSNLEVAVMGYGWNRSGDTYVADGTIGSYAFSGCSKLSYFVVPETVSSIGNESFRNNSSLALVTILGRPTISANSFSGAMGTGAVYYFDNSASYVSLSAATFSQYLFPEFATKRAYREIDFTATGELTSTLVNNRLTALGRTAANSWWKGKILSTVTSLGVQCFRGAASPNGIGTTNYPNMVGLSFPSSLTSIGYTAFGNSYGTNPVNCNVVGFYFPISVTNFPILSGGNYAFYSTNADGRTKSSTRQIVFQSGNSTVAFTGNMFLYNPAMAIIAPNVTSIGNNCFDNAKNVQLFNFFQKNAYTRLTRLDGITDNTADNAFVSCFNALTPHTQYLYIPKAVTRISTSAFLSSTNPLYITLHSSTTDGATGAGLCASTNFLTNTHFTGTGALNFHLINNYYDANGLTLGSFGPTTGNYHVLFSSGVKTISDRFRNSSILKTVTIPDSVTSIMSIAFQGCSALTSVSFSPTSTLSTIGTQAFHLCTGLTTFAIPSLVTDISSNAFLTCTALTSVSGLSTGTSLVNIGNHAFSTCTSLTDISMNRVKSIGINAFRNALLSNTFDLTSATSLEAIYHAAFYTDTGGYTSNISQITIPQSVKAIGSYAFGCGSTGLKPFFTTLSFQSGIEFWGDGGEVGDKATLAEYGFPDTNNARYMAIPAYFCQNCNFLTSIANVLNKNPKYIGNSAFLRCNQLTTLLTIPDNVTIIGDSAFSGCYGLTSVGFSPTSTLTSIGDSAFSECYGLTSVGFSPTSTLTSIGISAFMYCYALTTIDIPSLVTNISTAAFLSCSALTSVSGLSTGSLVNIGNRAFESCISLTDISMNRVKSIGITAFYNVPLSNTFDLSGATSLEAIYSRAFVTDTSGKSNIKQITIPNSVKVLGSGVFDCSQTGAPTGLKPSFTSLSFQNGIEFLGDYDNTLSSTGTIAGYGVDNSSNVRYMAIPANFCEFCNFLNSVSFLDTLDSGGNAIIADAGGALARPNNSLPITTRLNKQTLSPAIRRIGAGAFGWNHRLQSIRIPDGVTTIDFQAFYDAYSLSYIYLPDSLTTEIGIQAFSFANIDNKFGYIGKQVSVRLPQSRIDDVNTTRFGTYDGSAFHITVSFDNTSTKVVSGVLGRFTSQAANSTLFYHVVTLNGITGILGSTENNQSAFDNFTNLKTVTIADTVASIGWRAFSDCTGLTNVFISPTSNLTLLENGAFVNCSALTSFFIPNSLKGIETSGFNNTSLATVTYGDNPGLKYISHAAFYGTTTKTLTSIFIPSSVVHIGSEAFITGSNADINRLNTVTFGAGSRLKSIDYQCFGGSFNTVPRGAQYLRDLVLPSSLRYMGPITSDARSPISNTHVLAHSANLVVPSSVEVIPWAFLFANEGTVDISNVYFPRSITNVAGPRVHNGFSMNSATPSTSTGLAGAEFSNSKSGSHIYLPSELSAYTTVTVAGGTYAFPGTNRARSFYKTVSFTDNPLITLNLSGTVDNSTNATTTTQIHANIQEGVIVIGNGTTSIAGTGTIAPRNLISVNIPSTVTNISANAFSGSSALVYVTFSENSKLSTIGDSAFLGCSMIHDIQLPNSLTTIGPNAFSGCTNLASISIPYNVTSIGAGAFARSTVAKLIGGFINAEANSDYSGYSVSMNSDGTIVAIGANQNDGTSGFDNRGHVRVYKYQTITDTTWTNYTININVYVNKPIVVNDGDANPVANKKYWVLMGGDIDGEAASDQSGYSVSLSADGLTVAIGAIRNLGTSNNFAGHVRVYKYDPNKLTNVTDQASADYGPVGWRRLGQDIDGEAYDDESGYSVSLSADGLTVAIGSIQNYAGGGSTDNRGHVRVYKYQTITDASWNSYTINSLTYNGTSPTDKPIIVNGGDANPVSGKYYWVQMGVDIDGEAASDRSGRSVSLSSDGTIVAIGANNNDGTANSAGHVRVYKYDVNKLTNVSDQSSPDYGPVGWRRLGQDIDGEAYDDDSGYSVSLSADGTTVAIGAINNDGTTGTSSDRRGHVRVYQYQTITDLNWTNYNNTNFTYDGATNNKPIVVAGGDSTPVANKYYWVQMGVDIDGEAASDFSGWSVSLSKTLTNGIIVAIGAHYAGAGQVRIYQYDSTKTADVTDQSSTDYGPIGWRRLGKDFDGGYHRNYGTSVSLSKDGTTVAIGAPNTSSIGTSSAVYVFQINPVTIPIRLHEKLYNDISGSFSTYFPGISTSSVQVIPELQLTNTLNPAKLTISQINNIYIRYRQSQLGFCTRVTVNATGVGGSLTGDDITNALSGTTGLVHLDLSGTSINSYLCENNARIYSVAISKTVTSIGTSAFNGCKNLTYLSFHPDSTCTTIMVNAFNSGQLGGNKIFDLALPDSLTTIQTGAFQSSNRLTSVCIPKNVTSIGLGDKVFGNCPNLTSVALPSQLSTANTSSYFNTNGSAVPGSFTIYDTAAAIPHFKLSDYSMPSGIVQTVIDSAVTYIDHRAYAYYPDITLYSVTTNKQTQTAGQFNYVMNGVKMPVQPAAFILNGSFASNSMFPLYRSIPDLNVFSLSDVSLNWIQNNDDYYILMPEYSICIYNNLYDEENLFTASPTERYYDNEFGKVPLNITVPSGIVNTTTSVLIMYKGRILSKYFST